MTTAHHLRLIDGVRSREFPSERTASGSGVSGPGFHTVHLYGEEVSWSADEEDHVERRAQCQADHDALVTLLTLRWGEPQAVSLWSARERLLAGEEMAEPWADTVLGCEHLPLWRMDDRWITVTLHLERDGTGCELSVLVTSVDPP